MADALTDAGKHALLDSDPTWPPSYLSLHTGSPGSTGANEAAGGSPAYARLAATWAAAANGRKATNADVTFNVPAGTYYWVGMWTALTAGSFYAKAPLQGDLSAAAAARRSFVAAAAATDVIDSPGHGFADGDQVVVWAAGGTLPGGLAEETVYHVRDATADTFRLAASSGGAAIDLTSVGTGQAQRIVPEVFAAQGTLTVRAGLAVVL